MKPANLKECFILVFIIVTLPYHLYQNHRERKEWEHNFMENEIGGYHGGWRK